MSLNFRIFKKFKIIFIFIVFINAYSVLGTALYNPVAVETLNKGVIFASEGNFEQAIVQYNNALNIDPNFSEAWAFKGEALMHIGNYTEALASFDNALYLKNDSAEVWLNHGYVLGKLYRYKEALESYNESIRLDNRSMKNAWYNKGNILGILGNYEEALKSYDIALSIDANFSEAWNNRGHYLDKIGKYNEALSSYDKATEINPNYTDAWHNRGYTFSRLGRYKEAVDSYSKAIILNPTDIKSLIGKGTSLVFLGRYDEALTTFDEVIRIDPNNSLAWYNKGNTFYLMKNYSAAKDSNQRATKLFWGTKKLDINATLEVDPDLINDQIGVVGKTYSLIVYLNAKEDIDLSNNIYIEFNKNSRQINFNNSNEILVDVLIDGNDYWGPLVYNLEYKLGRRILPSGQSDRFKVNVTFLSPGVYNIIITTHERLVPFVIQIVDPLTMRDLKNGITSLQVAKESKELAQYAIFATIIAAVIGSAISYLLPKRREEQKEIKEYLNLVNTKLDQIENTRQTWMRVRDYKSIRDNFVLISSELTSIISKAPHNFPKDILNDLRALYQSLNDLSAYTFGLGIDAVFEERTQIIVNNAQNIKLKNTSYESELIKSFHKKLMRKIVLELKDIFQND